MNKVLLTSLLFFFLQSINAQLIEVINTGIGEPSGLAFKGNDLYIAEQDRGRISKLDVTNPLPTKAIDVVTGLNNPNGIVFKGNDLYIAERYGNKISKIDITATNPIPVDVVTGLNEPAFLAFKGNELYIAEQGGNKISKIDITATNPVPIEVAPFRDPYVLVFHDNDLYVGDDSGRNSAGGGGIVSKIDITMPLPTVATYVTTVLNRPNGLAIDDDNLYIAEVQDTVFHINVTVNPVVKTTIFTGIGKISRLVFHNGDLYIGDWGGRVLKFEPKPPCALNLTITNQNNILTSSQTGRTTYRWLDCDNNFASIVNATNQSFTAVNTGNYAVEITKDGCVDTSGCTAIELQVLDTCQIYIPNTFTPNNDYINTLFSIRIPVACVKSFQAEIFDQGGKTIATSTNIKNIWDGKNSSGKDMPINSYAYKMVFVTKDNEPIVRRGFINLLR